MSQQSPLEIYCTDVNLGIGTNDFESERDSKRIIQTAIYNMENIYNYYLVTPQLVAKLNALSSNSLRSKGYLQNLQRDIVKKGAKYGIEAIVDLKTNCADEKKLINKESVNDWGVEVKNNNYPEFVFEFTIKYLMDKNKAEVNLNTVQKIKPQKKHRIGNQMILL